MNTTPMDAMPMNAMPMDTVSINTGPMETVQMESVPTTTMMAGTMVAGTESLEAARTLLCGTRVVALTGAGLSTDSGIPDYRGPGSPPRTPMTIAQFRSGVPARQRYWARSFLGWQQMGTARPNGGHAALATMGEPRADRPWIETLITQNVDTLHTVAGSPAVTDLHGRIREVLCLDCGQITSRASLQERLQHLNPTFDSADVTINPDGDAEVEDVRGFAVAACLRCGGVLKPNVVFFGESVPRSIVQRCFAAVDASDTMLVAGTSLTVWSGLRFVRHAARAGKPIVLINRGPTRADDLITLRIDHGCTGALTALAGR